MAHESKITSKVDRLSNVLLEGNLSVPWHQRYYDWDKEHVEDLLHDLQAAHESDQSTYFLGSIMLVDKGDQQKVRRDINDGQQRLITFSILLALLTKSLAKKHPKGRKKEMIGVKYLFQVDESEVLSITEASRHGLRLRAPRSDEVRFRQILCGSDVGTNGKMTDAWNAIRNFVDALGAQVSAKFFDFLLKNVEVAILEVPAGMDANSIFEALNGRGKDLGDLDLLRNRLYAYFADDCYETQRETIHNSLENALEILGGRQGARGGNKAEEYFRCFFQCEYGFLKKSRFYKDVKKLFPNNIGSSSASNKVFGLIERMTNGSCVELFRTILSASPNSKLLEEFKRAGRPAKKGLRSFLRELKKYKVSHPLLFALMRRFLLEEDPKLRQKALPLILKSIRNLDAFVMRTAFCATKFEPSKFEAIFANHAQRISAASRLDDLDLYDFLVENDIYGVIPNPAFISQMEGASFTDSRKAKGYLFGINAISQSGSGFFEDVGEQRFTVEHVLPKSQKHWKGWDGFSEIEASECVHRVGNLILLAEDENNATAGFNASFEAKRETFANSSLKLARDAADFPQWTPDVVDSQSRRFAEQAAKAWSFDASACQPARS